MAVPLSARGDGSTSYMERAKTEFAAWPVLAMAHAPDAVVFTVGDIPILRLTGRDTAHLHLTRPVVERLHEALATSAHVHLAAQDGWIALRLDTRADLDLLVALVSLAIKANTDPA
ncbi:luciferase domain-containing protein [Nonomuraea guangzhouensis]|uniref:Luciferase family protein n=1 Tax=Nonomuraea guangzhouensis TaxID=1291555 RepID=A0ABW4G7B0_9ACTN|nr:luciferase family protein [Nonomuraea guangzhouensis]